MKTNTKKLELMLNMLLASAKEVYGGSSAHVINALDLIATDPCRAMKSSKITRFMSALVPIAETCKEKEFLALSRKSFEVIVMAAMHGQIEHLEKFNVIDVDEQHYIVRKHIALTQQEIDEMSAEIFSTVTQQV